MITLAFSSQSRPIHSSVPLRLRDHPSGAAPVAFHFLMDRRVCFGRLEEDDIAVVGIGWTAIRISKCFHVLRLRRLLWFSLCPYRFGDLDSLPDFVIVVALPGRFGTFFLFGVAIMSPRWGMWAGFRHSAELGLHKNCWRLMIQMYVEVMAESMSIN